MSDEEEESSAADGTATEATSSAGDDLEGTAVVIDNGTGFIKIGTAGNSSPDAAIPNIVGRPMKGKLTKRKPKGEPDAEPITLVGEKVLEQTGGIDITYAMEHGIIENWDDMERLWRHGYDTLELDPTEQPVLLTEAPYTPKRVKEKMAEIMFEALDVPGLQIKMQALCSLFASGRTTGLCLDSGDGVTHAVPVIDGFVDGGAIMRTNVAGRDITRQLQRMLFDQGYNFNSPRELQFVREIKEKACFVALDFDEEMRLVDKKITETEAGRTLDDLEFEYELPDGQEITLAEERFRAPEVLFNPMKIELEVPGLHQITWQSIQTTGIDCRKTLLANVLLSGGNTMFPGLGKRLQSELQLLAPPGATVIKVMEDPKRYESVWVGASVLANLDSFAEEWVTQKEYQESGMAAVHAKCFSCKGEAGSLGT